MEENFMASRTFGENMAIWEEDADIRHFVKRFEKALDAKNYQMLKILINEGMRNGYSLPETTDVNVMEMKADAFMALFKEAEREKKYSAIVKLYYEAIKCGYPIPAPSTSIVSTLLVGLMSA